MLGEKHNRDLIFLIVLSIALMAIIVSTIKAKGVQSNNRKHYSEAGDCIYTADLNSAIK